MSAPDSSPARSIPLRLAGDLFRQLSDLTEGGFTPAEAVAVLKEDAESPRTTAMLDAIGQDLAREPSLARALERHASAFGPETVAFVGAAEGQNALAGGLATLADDYERRQQLRFARLAIPLVWPLFVLGVLALVMMVLMIFVVPAFKEVFGSFGADLPGLTLAVMALSDLVVTYWWILFALVIALPFGVAFLRRQPGLGMALDAAFLKLPGVRRFLVKVLVGRLLALLAGATANRIPLATTIAYLASTLGNRSLKAVVATLGRDVEQGTPLPAAWRKQPLLPRRIARMVDIGERSDKLARVLARAARVHGAEADNASAVFGQVLFVTAYVVTAIIVGFMVVAMYFPIFKLGGVS